MVHAVWSSLNCPLIEKVFAIVFGCLCSMQEGHMASLQGAIPNYIYILNRSSLFTSKQRNMCQCCHKHMHTGELYAWQHTLMMNLDTIISVCWVQSDIS